MRPRTTFAVTLAAASLASLAATGAGPIKIGAVLPFSGGVELYGRQAKLGLELAAKDINAGGGILGRPVELLYEDDKTDPAAAVDATRKLIGGGDVKLIAAVSLWAGLEHFVWFMLVTSLAGGALSLISLWSRRFGGVIGARLAALGLATPGGPGAVLSDAPRPAPAASAHPVTLPYGVAIAVGGIAVAIQSLKL